jgi:hypothetical protein
MVQLTPVTGGPFMTHATSHNPHIDGSMLKVGAHIYHDVVDDDGHVMDRLPVTITSDNGVSYMYVDGHVDVYGSNMRERLFLTSAPPLTNPENDIVTIIRTMFAREVGGVAGGGDLGEAYPFMWVNYSEDVVGADPTEEIALTLPREVCDREILRIFESERPTCASDFQTVMVMIHG